MWMRRVLLPLRLPRAPGGGLLLGNADQNDLAFATLLGRGAEQRLSDLFFVFAFGEVANRNTLGLGPAVDSGDVGFTDLTKGCRRGDLKPRRLRNWQTCPTVWSLGTYACRNRRSIERQVSVM